VRALALGPDGRTAAGSTAGRVVVFDLEDGTAAGRNAGEAPVTALEWTPDGTRLLAASEDGALRLWLRDGEEPLWVDAGTRGGVSDLAFDPEGARLLVVRVEGDSAILEADGAHERLLAHERERALRSRASEAAVRLLPATGSETEAFRRALEVPDLDADLAATLREMAVERAFRGERLRRAAWEAVTRADTPPEEQRRALEYAREASRLMGNDSWTDTTLAGALFRDGRAEEALHRLQEALQSLKGARRAAASALLGLVLCREGQPAQAREVLRGLPDTGGDEAVARLVAELEDCLGARDGRP
jgi:tetratricopeptide (TPR) repeat protein